MSVLSLKVLLISLCAAALAFPASAAAQDSQENVWEGWDDWDDQGEKKNRRWIDRSISHQGFGLRLGYFIQGLADTEIASPFHYFDFGLRFKTGEYYFDFRAPSILLILDGLYVLGREIFFFEYTELFVERLNNFNAIAFWEIAHGKMGYRFRIAPPPDLESWTEPVDVALGVFASLELLFLDFRRDIDRDSDYYDLGYDDPLVVSAGGFLAIGDTKDHLQYDVALAFGAAIRGEYDNPDRQIFLTALDADFQYEIGYGAALYLRPRLHAYITKTTPAIHIAGALSAGLNIRF